MSKGLGTDLLAHDKKAFYKFFLTYFISVALLIVSTGYFYQQQIYNQLFKAEHFSIIKYARHLKSGTEPKDESFHYEIENGIIENFSMDNIKLTKTHFMKRIPYQWKKGYYVIYKKRTDFDKLESSLTNNVIYFQIILLIIFGFISLFLAKNALKPMKEAISKLDSFSKDLIHDLNTPITAINLNMKILQKNDAFKENKALNRIQKSVLNISELHQNLRLLLEEETFQLVDVNVSKILEELILTHQVMYPKLSWKFMAKDLYVKTNEKALRQVLQNIISNACKYNVENGIIKIKSKDKSLIISDSGIGINDTKKVFDRNYTEHQSGFGIGLDIVKRLCDSMDIKIEIKSSNKGTSFILIFQ